MFRHLALAAAGLCCAFFSAPAIAGNELSHQQLQSLFPGNFTAVVRGYTVQIAARGNGVLVGRVAGLQDTGRWSVSGGRLCVMLASWTAGKPQCSTVVADSGWYLGQGVKFRKP